MQMSCPAAARSAALGDRPVDVQPLVVAGVGHRQHDRPVLRDDTDVGDHARVEDGQDAVAVVLGADGATAEADPVAGRFGGHG